MSADGTLVGRLLAELDRASRAERVWVMDLDRYKQLRRSIPAYKPEDDDEDKWVPDINDLMFGLHILVRDDGGEPHIEWLTPEETGL